MTQESSLIKNCVGLVTDLAGALRTEVFYYYSYFFSPRFLFFVFCFFLNTIILVCPILLSNYGASPQQPQG